MTVSLVCKPCEVYLTPNTTQHKIFVSIEIIIEKLVAESLALKFLNPIRLTLYNDDLGTPDYGRSL